jgi:hypothetical protein
MTTPDYTQKMSELRTRVGQHAILTDENNTKSKFATIASVMPTITTKSPIFYIIPPIALIVILLFTRPGFVCTDHIDKDNVITQKVNYKKLIIYGLIGGGVISIGLFAYFKQKTD